jgi:hypothetical protein
MRTTLDLPDETFRRLKARAAMRGFKLKELVAQMIERGLAEDAVDPPTGRTDRLQRQPAPAQNPYPIPIAREADGTVTPYLSNQQLHAILDDDDMAQYQRVLEQ